MTLLQQEALMCLCSVAKSNQIDTLKRNYFVSSFQCSIIAGHIQPRMDFGIFTFAIRVCDRPNSFLLITGIAPCVFDGLPSGEMFTGPRPASIYHFQSL